MSKKYGFIVIDDDPISILITRQVIKEYPSESGDVISFNSATEALRFLEQAPEPDHLPINYILLDLNMPEMSGWQFIDEYIKLPEESRESYRIYILSSSLDVRDKSRAKGIEAVAGYIVKPLSSKSLKEIIG